MPSHSHPKATIYRESIVGVTSPYLMGFDDGNDYIVKFRENTWGPRVVVNEYLVGKISETLGFSHNECGLVEVEQTFIDDQPELDGNNGGLQFGSLFREDALDFSPGDVGELKNEKDLPQVVVLDTLFCNDDRHPQNILVVPGRGTGRRSSVFYMIDNSHAFEGKDWDQDVLAELSESPKLYMDAVNFNVIRPEMDTFKPSLIKLEALQSSAVKSLIDSFPDQWEVSDGEKQALKDFINARKKLVRNIIENHLSERGTS